jgi:hypothetical protein
MVPFSRASHMAVRRREDRSYSASCRQSGLNESSRALGIDRLRFLFALPHSGFIFAFAANPYARSVRSVAVDFPRLIRESVLLQFDPFD